MGVHEKKSVLLPITKKLTRFTLNIAGTMKFEVEYTSLGRFAQFSNTCAWLPKADTQRISVIPEKNVLN